jgi:transcriptional regulator with GAF, ATPase, and Fis domain
MNIGKNEVSSMDEQVRSTLSIATADRAPHRSIQEIARRAVPALADFAVVFMVARHSIVCVASAHISPAGDRLLRALQRIYRIRRNDLQSTVAQVIRTGRPLLRRSIQYDGQPARRGSVADLHRRLACRSALVLPIRIGPTVAGAVTLCYAGSGRTYARADLAGAQRVAREIVRTVPLPVPHAAAPRLRAAVGDARRQASVRRRVAARN